MSLLDSVPTNAGPKSRKRQGTDMNRVKCVVCSVAVVAWLLCLPGGVEAQSVDGAIGAAESMDDAARGSQARIDQTVDQTRSLEREYAAIMKEIDGLEVYNALLEKQLASQDQEIADLNYSIDQVSVIERQVTPLMLKMIDSLEQFVELDMPFLLEERRKRVAFPGPHFGAF